MLIIGLVVGAVAKFLVPGKDPGGIIITMVIGVVGAMIAGFIGRSFGGYQTQGPSIIASVLGAMLLLFIYRVVVGRRR